MRTIYKYRITENDMTIKAPIERILDVDYKNDSIFGGGPVGPYLWAVVNTEKEDKDVRIVLFPTGVDIGETSLNLYMKTINDGVYVWHVFVEGAPFNGPAAML